MDFLIFLFILAYFEVVSAVPGIPRRPAVFKKRQASTCSCPSNVHITSTSLFTTVVTSSATVSTDAGGVEVTADTQTDTTTIPRTTTVTAANRASSTVTTAGATRTTSVSATTITQTSTISSTTVTTCIVSAYKAKRQNTDSSTATNAPSTTTVTTNFGASTGKPATCVCRLISAFTFPGTTSTSTSPTDACSCASILTYTTAIVSTVTATYATTSTIQTHSTSTYTPETIATEYADSTITTTITTTFTVSTASLTSTIRSTVTVTTTVTPTYVSCPTADLTCSNQGLRWGLYRNTNSAGANNTNSDSTYSTFNPTVFKDRVPKYQNITYTMGGFDYASANPVYISFYNSTQKFYSDYIVINHVGYVFAQVSGTYTFSISKSDDITLFWLGSTAYSGYTRANANIVNPYGAGTGSYSVSLVAGDYYPIRIMFANAQQAIVFEATLTAPDGTVILTSNSQKSPYLVQYSCDGTAPAFPAFGSET